MAAATINGHGPFYEAPACCGCCKCGINSDMNSAGGRTWCTLFSKQKNYYDSPPKRCSDMFDKALAMGGELVLVKRER